MAYNGQLFQKLTFRFYKIVIKIPSIFLFVELAKLIPLCFYVEEQKAKNNKDIRVSGSNVFADTKKNNTGTVVLAQNRQIDQRKRTESQN